MTARYDVALRDSALLALLIGCGLRRSEAANARLDQWRDLRQGRHALCDIAGKHGRVRTVIAPEWVAQRMNRWIEHRYGGGIIALSDGSAPLITPVRGQCDSALSVSAVWKIVQGYATALGWGPIAPHDLRRTYARLCREGGCPMEELQMALGHESVRTTERYVNQRLDVGRAAGDWIAL